MISGIGLNRRTMLQRVFALAGVAALPGGAEALAAAANGGTRQLSASRYQVLVAVADTIIPKTETPGALDTKVPQSVDALLGTWASPKRKAELIGAIDEIDRLAFEDHQRGFAALIPTERASVLAPHDAAALSAPLSTPALGTPSDGAPTTVDPNYSRLKQEPAQETADPMSLRFTNPPYARLKELIVLLHYYSEAALASDLTYEHSPGPWQPSIPVTASTRPWGGIVV